MAFMVTYGLVLKWHNVPVWQRWAKDLIAHLHAAVCHQLT